MFTAVKRSCVSTIVVFNNTLLTYYELSMYNDLARSGGGTTNKALNALFVATCGCETCPTCLPLFVP